LADYYTEVATRYRITLEGVVQGVGFRPFVKRLADRVALRNGRRGQAAEVSFHISERGCRDSHQDDLAQAVEFSSGTAHRNIQCVRPGIRVFEVSAKTGGGVAELIDWFCARS
jgi:hypothetical protein